MSNQSTAVAIPFKKYLEKSMPKIEESLPETMSGKRFQSIAAMAINNSPKLADCARDNPQLVLGALMQCAADGLMPDNREATMTAYNGKGGWQLTYNPMIAGLLKRLYQTGLVKDVMVELVYQDDVDKGNFSITLGDNPKITHTPDPFAENRGEKVGVYAIVKMLNGGVFREFMNKAQVMSVKGAAPGAQYGPWSGAFAGEMWRKSVLRRCIKKCPVSSDVMALFQRDDSMYKFGGNVIEASAVDTFNQNMDDVRTGKSQPLIEHDPEPKEKDNPQAESHAENKASPSDPEKDIVQFPAAPESMTGAQWETFTNDIISDYYGRGLSDDDFDKLYSFELGAIAQYSSEDYNKLLDAMNSDG